MLIWVFVAIALLLQIPVVLTIFALAIILQRTSQASYLRTLDNREKQLAYVVQGVMASNADLASKITIIQGLIDRQGAEKLAKMAEIHTMIERQGDLIDRQGAEKLAKIDRIHALIELQALEIKRSIQDSITGKTLPSVINGVATLPIAGADNGE